MAELTAILDPATGKVTLEGMTPEEAAPLLADLLGAAQSVNCARPNDGVVSSDAPYWHEDRPGAVPVRLNRVWHGSVVDGPGVRSVIQFQGCPIRCAGCFVPQTHDADGGFETGTDQAIEAALAAPHDGITILGGEPFAQPEALADIVGWLKAMDEHVLVYTGYTVESLKRRQNRHIDEVLRLADLIIDGPFLRSRTEGAGQWRGSTNQRVLTREEVARL